MDKEKAPEGLLLGRFSLTLITSGLKVHPCRCALVYLLVLSVDATYQSVCVVTPLKVEQRMFGGLKSLLRGIVCNYFYVLFTFLVGDRVQIVDDYPTFRFVMKEIHLGVAGVATHGIACVNCSASIFAFRPLSLTDFAKLGRVWIFEASFDSLFNRSRL